MPDEETTPTTQDISFTINDGTDPIQGASVKIGSETKTTGSAGGCSFTAIEEGTVSVEVSKEGYTTKTESITVDSEHTSFTISLVATAQEETTPTTQDISFTINDGTDPIQGASVKIGSETKTTGSAGGCSFTAIEEGTVSVEVSKEGYTTKTESITVDSEHTTFTISLVATTQEETGGGSSGTETGGSETGGSGSEETTEETTEEKFPSFRKAYKYRGGFDKFVYDQLKKANSSEEESDEE